MAVPGRKFAAVVCLLLVSPLVAEYLLGDLPITLLAVLAVLVPAYGGAAVLVRETARRRGQGWPGMLLLGAAYGLASEGLVTQSLFNPDYLKIHMHLLDHAYVPEWGIGAWWTLLMLNLHTFWSMGVSIALVEALFPEEAHVPWLGRGGVALVAVVFVLGSAASFAIGWKQNHFVASAAQLVSVAGLSLLLVGAAWLLPVRGASAGAGGVPSPWATGAATFVLGMGVLQTPARWGWGAVLAMLALDAVFLMLLSVYTQRAKWGGLHALSVAAAGAMDYGVRAFAQKPLLGGIVAMRVSNAVLLVAAVWLVWLGARRVVRARQAAQQAARHFGS
ncbi:hypothetical protein [Acidipila sp. EB88]|uniref:hypothetical protein n=1 Tax=Acidipila sp. EB88 TaxID=2305226 RepID=UPI000F5E7454|nr:hypothetical protein [Acidipila sp. EB88]